MSFITATLPYYVGLGFLGFVSVRFLLRVLKGIQAHFLGPAVALKKQGEWAVVTGATDGIGKVS